MAMHITEDNQTWTTKKISVHNKRNGNILHALMLYKWKREKSITLTIIINPASSIQVLVKYFCILIACSPPATICSCL